MTTRDFCFSYKDLAITWEDFLIHAPEQSNGLDDFPDTVQAVLEWANESLEATGGYRLLPLDACLATTLSIGGQHIETGHRISRYLNKAEQIAVFVCTAGRGIHNAYQRYLTEGDSLSAYIADTLGTVVVEKTMDRIALTLEFESAQSGFNCTNRYSPGYCGWSVCEQQKLWTLLPTGFCGITLLPSSLMSPVKSISGVIGLGKNAKKTSYGCSNCDREHCLYRKQLIKK